MKKATALRLALVAALAAPMLAACGGSDDAGGSGDAGAGKNMEILLSAENSFEFLPAELGIELGVWEKRGLNVKNTYVSGGQWATTIASGTGDIGLASGQMAGNIKKGIPIKVIGAIGYDFKMMVLVASNDSGVKSASDLKGKVVGITSPGSLTEDLARRLIKAEGWAENDVKIASAGGYAEQLAALESGATDAFIWTAEAGFQLEEGGTGKVIDNFSEYVPNVVFQGFSATDETISKRPEDIKSYLEGWYEVARYMKENREETVAFMAKTFNVSETVAAKTYDYDIDNLSLDGAITPERVKGMAQYSVDEGDLDSLPAEAEYFDGQFVPVTAAG